MQRGEWSLEKKSSLTGVTGNLQKKSDEKRKARRKEDEEVEKVKKEESDEVSVLLCIKGGSWCGFSHLLKASDINLS
jgi:hypothetical protein